MKTLSKIFLNTEPFKNPGRFIFWVLLDLVFVVTSVRQNVYYASHNNVGQTIWYLALGLVWALWLYNDLDRWFLPKQLPVKEIAPRSTTLEDVE